MERQEVKEIVYKCIKNIFIDENEFNIFMTQHSNDGEDLFLYNEIELDSLDILTFIIELEKEFNIIIDDTLFNNDCTLRIIIDYIYDKKK